MTVVDFDTQTKLLIQEVKAKLGCEIEFKKKGKQVGYLRHDQAQHYLRGGKMVIELNDLTAPSYTVSHELLHILLMTEKIPEITFNLSTTDLQLDTKLMAVGLELYDIVLHFTIYQLQRERNLFTESIQDLYLKGLFATLKPEPDGKNDNWMVLRVLGILDALVFFGKKQELLLSKLKKYYPQTTKAALSLYTEITAHELESPFGIRRAVIKLYHKLDEYLSEWGLEPLNLNRFVTLTLVLSKRQARQQVRQLFEIYHSALHENLEDTKGYIGFYKKDGQNSFVLPQPKESHPEEKFRKIYAMQAAVFLKELSIPYLIR
ncbi:hypothetical protein [Liquorilactobacillus oeni]|uniref:IpaB EvcA family protein n=1 Tax=Liquorilactobacillus oeni DSM 19972 TaxID=1423777 RepID=A0A0R1MP23_9LACO|nr:hypothetical protein [Liquorilactobacillus oeni]KRL06187.1 IpaB EvcA family protein [Liquorilactobacillus oeni DSM 19972]